MGTKGRVKLKREAVIIMVIVIIIRRYDLSIYGDIEINKTD